MRKVKISLQDLLAVLQAMDENGTTDIIVFDHNGIPAICDADEQDNIITFQTYDDSVETKDGDSIH